MHAGSEENKTPEIQIGVLQRGTKRIFSVVLLGNISWDTKYHKVKTGMWSFTFTDLYKCIVYEIYVDM